MLSAFLQLYCFLSCLVNMGNCGSFDPDDEFSYHPDEWCDQCNCPKPPVSQVCVCAYVCVLCVNDGFHFRFRKLPLKMTETNHSK